MRKKKVSHARQVELDLIEHGKRWLSEQAEHPLVRIARAIPDPRRRRFIAGLAKVLSYLTADEMDKIEPHLREALGRVWIKDLTEKL
jgi:hypothetical protein